MHQRVELEPPGLYHLFAARMHRVNDRHTGFFRDAVHRTHQIHEVFFVVNVLLTVGREQDVLPRCKPQPGQHLAGVYLPAVGRQHLGHGAAGDKDGFPVDALIQQIAAGMLGVGQVYVTDVVHNLAVNHLADIPVPAAVPRLHVKNGDFEALGTDRREGGVGIPQHQQGLWLLLLQNLIAFGDDIPHGLAKVAAGAVEVDVGLAEA